tara:strand:- start:2556 stop:3002 length:447 start_codon:yes stop_codon:yes gene_type:complete
MFASNDEKKIFNYIKKKLIDTEQLHYIKLIKSTYQFSNIDFLLLNTQSLKILYVEVKSVNHLPSIIDTAKIVNIRKFYYNNCILLYLYNKEYYWIYTKHIDWDTIDIIEVLGKSVYNIEPHFSKNIDKLKELIFIGMLNYSNVSSKLY